MEKKYQEALAKRNNNTLLKDRLHLYSKIIYCTLQQYNDKNKKTIESILNTLIRKSSELNHYTKSTDFVPAKESKNRDKHEHIVPCSVMQKHFIDNPTISKDEIFDILLKNGLRAIISVQDNNIIDTLYRKSMPLTWKFGDNPLIRYESIINNIKLRDN